MQEPPTRPHRTLAHRIADLGRHRPEVGFVFRDGDGREHVVPYGLLDERTAGRAAALQAQGLRRGDRVGLVVAEPEAFVITFLAAVRIGVVPVPLAPPVTLGGLDRYAERSAAVLAAAGARLLLASGRLQNVLWALVERVASLERVVTVERLVDGPALALPELRPDDVAYLRFTVVTPPRAVAVSHRALLASCRDGWAIGGLGDLPPPPTSGTPCLGREARP